LFEWTSRRQGDCTMLSTPHNSWATVSPECIWQPPEMVREEEDQCDLGLELTCTIDMERIILPNDAHTEKSGIDLKFKKVVVEFSEKDLDYGDPLPLLHCRHMPQKERFLHFTGVFISRYLSLD
jgi:hypothetical protein